MEYRNRRTYLRRTSSMSVCCAENRFGELSDGLLDRFRELSGDRWRKLVQKCDGLVEFAACRVGITNLHARLDRALRKIAAMSASDANLPARISSSPRSM